MKRIDASTDGIFDITWSKDSQWVAYMQGTNEVRMANVETQEIRVIGEGTCPGITANMDVVLERGDEIVRVSGSGAKTLLSRNDLVKDTPKRSPMVSLEGDRVVAVVCNVFDKESESKNAYPHRHFLALIPLAKGKPVLTDEQWYGGTMVWFPDNEKFAHFEFDSTGGPQSHIVGTSGEHLGTLAGLYPSISPDGVQVAVRPRTGGSLVVYTSKGTWADEDVEMSVMRIPATSTSQASATPPIWLNTRFVLVQEGGALWRIDTKRDKAEEMKKMPLPVQRRKHSMIASPSREHLAMEVETDQGFELRVLPLA